MTAAASVVHLIPNQPIRVRVVNRSASRSPTELRQAMADPAHATRRWPSSTTSSKIPTVILYDSSGTPKACGAETKDDAFNEMGLTECKVRSPLSSQPSRPTLELAWESQVVQASSPPDRDATAPVSEGDHLAGPSHGACRPRDLDRVRDSTSPRERERRSGLL